MNLAQVIAAFINGDTVWFAPTSVYNYLDWKRNTLPSAPFSAGTNVPHGGIDSLVNKPIIVEGMLVDQWEVSVSGKTMPISRIYISLAVFKTALKTALSAMADEAGAMETTIDGYADSVDEIGVPVLSISVETLDFGLLETELTFTISNIGEGDLDWTVTTSLPAKIAATPTSGNCMADVDMITVTVDRSNVSPGMYNPTVDIASDGGSGQVVLTVVVE